MDRFVFPPNRPAGDWINWRIGSGWFEVAGAEYRIDEVLAFLREAAQAADGGSAFGIVLVSDPGNQHHKNAIKVIGITGSHSHPRTSRHIGYVPRDVADEVAHIYHGTPIAAELKQAKVGDVRIFISIAGLIPRGAPNN